MSAKHMQSLFETLFIPIQVLIVNVQTKICTRVRAMHNLFSQGPRIA